MISNKFLALSIIAGGLMAGSAGAMADSLLPMNLGAAQVVPAAVVVTYNPQLHGMRCKVRSARCGHLYNGWYYERVWWSAPAVVPGGTVFVYDVHRHGPRYHARRPGFTYFYGGYYYSQPWWTIKIH